MTQPLRAVVIQDVAIQHHLVDVTTDVHRLANQAVALLAADATKNVVACLLDFSAAKRAAANQLVVVTLVVTLLHAATQHLRAVAITVVQQLAAIQLLPADVTMDVLQLLAALSRSPAADCSADCSLASPLAATVANQPVVATLDVPLPLAANQLAVVIPVATQDVARAALFNQQHP